MVPHFASGKVNFTCEMCSDIYKHFSKSSQKIQIDNGLSLCLWQYKVNAWNVLTYISSFQKVRKITYMKKGLSHCLQQYSWLLSVFERKLVP